MSTDFNALFTAKPTSGPITTDAPAAAAPAAPAAPAKVTSATFKPAFQSISDYGPFGQASLVSESLCATDQCAKDLALVVADLSPTIIALPPFGPGFIGKVQQVPWFAFPDGTIVNVGSLAENWMRGWTPNISEMSCRRDIANMMRYTTAQYEIGA